MAKREATVSRHKKRFLKIEFEFKFIIFTQNSEQIQKKFLKQTNL